MTTPLQAKVDLHARLLAAAIANPKAIPELDVLLHDGYEEIDRLFAADSPDTYNTATLRRLFPDRWVECTCGASESLPAAHEVRCPIAVFHNPLADGACPTGGINCDRDHDMVGGSVVHTR